MAHAAAGASFGSGPMKSRACRVGTKNVSSVTRSHGRCPSSSVRIACCCGRSAFVIARSGVS